jgi:putative transposase
LFFVDLTTRRVHIAGTTTNPDSGWMEQIARNVTDCEAGFLRGKRYLIVDRDSVFAPRFRSTLEGAGVAPPQRDGVVQVTDRLGGLLKYYHRAAA